MGFMFLAKSTGVISEGMDCPMGISWKMLQDWKSYECTWKAENGNISQFHYCFSLYILSIPFVSSAPTFLRGGQLFK